MTAVPLLALVTGCALAAMSAGRWQVSLAAWLAPALLLFFSRTQEPAVALIGGGESVDAVQPSWICSEPGVAVSTPFVGASVSSVICSEAVAALP